MDAERDAHEALYLRSKPGPGEAEDAAASVDVTL